MRQMGPILSMRAGTSDVPAEKSGLAQAGIKRLNKGRPAWKEAIKGRVFAVSCHGWLREMIDAHRLRMYESGSFGGQSE